MEKDTDSEDEKTTAEMPVRTGMQHRKTGQLNNSDTLTHAASPNLSDDEGDRPTSPNILGQCESEKEHLPGTNLMKTDVSTSDISAICLSKQDIETADDVATTSVPSARCENPSVSSDSTKNTQTDELKNVHHIKWIEWSEGKSPIVTQNENGPCPLLAIFNVLLLSKRITLGDGAEFISSSEILLRVAETIWETMPDDLPEDEKLNYEQNISDAIEVFPNLQTGLDVNMKFDGVKSFEYTSELGVFDLLRIPLYHGWLVDPQDFATNEILSGLSYNQAVEKVINYHSSGNSDDLQKGLIAQEFLESTASQITYYGIVSLREEIQPGSLAVLFRNNHFYTIHRHNEELFTLVTDLGFLKESNMVWESLSSVQGDSQFVDGKFCTSPLKSATASAQETGVAPNTDLDYQLALSMQHVQPESTLPESDAPPQHELTDFMLAQRLQEQENIAAQQAQSSHRQRSAENTNSRQPARNNKDDKCDIL